jgi:hypothetical protein
MSDIGLGPSFAIAFVAVFAVVFVVWVAVGGAVMRLAARWAGGVRIGYLRSCGVVALAGVVTLVLSLAVMWGFLSFGYASGLGTTTLLVTRGLLGLLVPVAVTAACAWLLVPGDGGRLSPLRALGVAALYCAAMLVLYLVVVMVPLLVLGGVPGVMR